MKSEPILIVAALFLAAAVYTAQEAYYYPGAYVPVPAQRHSLDIMIQSAPSGEVVSTAASQAEILVDNAHDNSANLGALYQAFTSMGVRIKQLNDWEELVGNETATNASIIVAGASAGFTKEELALAENLTQKILLLGDVENSSARDLGLRLGILFNNDYLYNLQENDANFRNVIYKRFSAHPATAGLKQVVLYSACSLDPVSSGIILTDANTLSSATELSVERAPAVAVRNVLAVCDESIFTEPYASIADNRAFIANIANWLSTP